MRRKVLPDRGNEATQMIMPLTVMSDLTGADLTGVVGLPPGLGGGAVSGAQPG
ncbi:hypothetical protein GCM10022226_82950 [Sphaerisporangium flaviroseum]|uniref:Uncharacterized protein n=1 Tax=Sphaerisporangium flaviroseum TaxID=509199 RepID=A0ABP7JKR2_9ACTN